MMGRWGDICCQVASGIIKSASLFCFMATPRLPSGAIIREECKKEQLSEMGSVETSSRTRTKIFQVKRKESKREREKKVL